MWIGTKKILTILAVLLLAISVTGCTSSDSGGDNGASSSSAGAGSATGDEYTNSMGMEFQRIEAGNFNMGTSKYVYSQPIHEVRIGDAFYIGTYEVTQAQWEEVMGNNPSNFKGDDNPVENVSWNDVQEFITKLNEMEGTTKYRLPTEAEWEYAAAAGTTTLYSFGEIDEDEGPFLKDYAWYQVNSYEKTHEVGQKLPNPWGLYDVHGNVWEYVQDSWVDNYGSASEDGSAVEKGSSSLRVARGGSYSSKENALYTAYRRKQDPRDGDSSIGFRLVMDA
ncbi:formylglycine-generating enzyme family protein [Methanolobus sediminis]|uniref:Formylglycine-generating enzyme family protein n=1 Tax=Methanolobus sediminis TaxID=3072978 RepID=A0AA51ULT6_9EURY|nr:formylglycine-generating enzyme family protein [Methanolobus sediminis]WMW25699.1 formylglycine-generating enzyme family protein [Methanolobus sediminis]